MGTKLSKTWLDCLPIEIIFCIFDYLSSNDIIYAFFYFNQRFNTLLLQNQRYLNYLNLPTINLKTWKNILSVIGPQVESLNINTIDPTFPLTLFSNLKSIIISSSYDFPYEQFEEIFKSEHFIHLHSFRIKQNPSFRQTSSDNYFNNQDYVLKKVFNSNCSLRTFECSFKITPWGRFTKDIYAHNLNLHSLTLILNEFPEVFKLISYTPNLKYLNLRTRLSDDDLSIPKVDTKLEQLYLTLDATYYSNRNSNRLMNILKPFSSSLLCLSLNLVYFAIKDINEIPFNSFKLQQLLEPMTELKQFHLYARLNNIRVHSDRVLSQFKNQYWFDRNLSFGMHGEYFYTLPFHFDYLYDFSRGFNDVKSNNPEMLENNPRLWYNVKSIYLSIRSKYDFNLIKELKMKMPKLTFIEFRFLRGYLLKSEDLYIKEDIRMTLDSVTMIECRYGSLQNETEWLIYALPNLTHLIVSSQQLVSIDNPLGEILKKRLQRLDIHVYYRSCDPLPNRSYAYFSNVQYLNFYLHNESINKTWYTDTLMKVFENCKNLQRLIIYEPMSQEFLLYDLEYPMAHNRLENLQEIMKNYEVKQARNCIIFSKQECLNAKIPSSKVLRMLSSFFHRKK